MEKDKKRLFGKIVPREGLLVRVIGSLAVLPKEGLVLPLTGKEGTYWKRRALCGDVTISSNEEEEGSVEPVEDPSEDEDLFN